MSEEKGLFRDRTEIPRVSRIVYALLGASCWLLMFLCFTLPDRTAPLSVGSLDPIAVMKLTTRAIVFMMLLYLFVLRWHRASSLTVFVSLGPLGLFVLWAIISTLWSPLKAVSFGQSSGLLILFLLASVVGMYCRGRAHVARFLMILVIGLLIFCAVVLAINRIDPEFGSLSRDNPGVFHPTTAGAASSLGILLALCSAVIWKFGWARYLFWPAMIVDSTLLLLSANRTATFLAILFCILFIVTLAGWLRGALISLGMLVLVLILLLPPFQARTTLMRESFDAYFTRDQDLTRLSGRDELWTVIWEEVKRSPLIGHGYFVTSAEGEFYFWHKWANWTAHNTLLQALVTTGIIGVLLLGAGVLWPIILLSHARSQNRFLSQLFLFVLISALWYSGWGIFSESFLGPIQPESVNFFSIIGIVAGNMPPGSFIFGRAGSSDHREQANDDANGITSSEKQRDHS